MPKRTPEKENRVPTGNESSPIRIFLDKVKSFFVGLWDLISSWLNKSNKTSSKVKAAEPVATEEAVVKEALESEIETIELAETKPTENIEKAQAVQKVEGPAKKTEAVADQLLEETRKTQLKIEEENRQKQIDEQQKAEEQQAAERKELQDMRQHAGIISSNTPLSYFLTQREKEKLKKSKELSRAKLSQELDLISNMSEHLEQSLRTFALELLSKTQQLQTEKGNGKATKEKIKNLESASECLKRGLEFSSLFDYRVRISSDGHDIIAHGPPNSELYMGNLITRMLKRRVELALVVDNSTIPTEEQIESSRQETRKLVEKIEKDSKLLNYTDPNTIPLRIELAILNSASRFKITEPAMYFIMIEQMAKIQAMLNKPKEEVPVTVNSEVEGTSAQQTTAKVEVGTPKNKNDEEGILEALRLESDVQPPIGSSPKKR